MAYRCYPYHYTCCKKYAILVEIHTNWVYTGCAYLLNLVHGETGLNTLIIPIPCIDHLVANSIAGHVHVLGKLKDVEDHANDIRSKVNRR